VTGVLCSSSDILLMPAPLTFKARMPALHVLVLQVVSSNVFLVSLVQQMRMYV
jgi:hypothetical protein